MIDMEEPREEAQNQCWRPSLHKLPGACSMSLSFTTPPNFVRKTSSQKTITPRPLSPRKLAWLHPLTRKRPHLAHSPNLRLGPLYEKAMKRNSSLATRKVKHVQLVRKKCRLGVNLAARVKQIEGRSPARISDDGDVAENKGVDHVSEFGGQTQKRSRGGVALGTRLGVSRKHRVSKCYTYMVIRCAANLADVLSMLIVVIGVVGFVDRGAELKLKLRVTENAV
jgi:hypothetical protein